MLKILNSGHARITILFLFSLNFFGLQARQDEEEKSLIWESYPAYPQYIEAMESFAENYPGICSLVQIGESVMGRKLLVLKITDYPGEREPEPCFFFSSTMHGDEATGFVLMLRLIDHILKNYGRDDQITRLVDNIEIWINPLANPDGTYYESDKDSDLSGAIRENGNGVNLNRNFPDPYDGPHPDGYDYQPETLAMMRFMDSIHLVLSANIHDGEEVFNYPWDTFKSLHPDNDWFVQMGRDYVSTVRSRTGIETYPDTTHFPTGITNGYDWYEVIGGRQDYVTYFLHGREVTLEISNDKTAPADRLYFLWYYNYPSWLNYIENCLFGIQGIVRDSVSLDPVQAMIRIPGHDSMNSHVISDSLTGYFARLIQEGTWNLEFSAEGYQPRIVYGIQTWNQESVSLEVLLIPDKKLTGGLNEYHFAENPRVRNSEILIDIVCPDNYQLCIYSLDGKLIYKDQYRVSSPVTLSVPVSHTGMDAGIYLFSLISSRNFHSWRIFNPD